MTVGQDTGLGLPAIAHQVTEQQPVQAESPTVEAAGLDAHFLPVGLIQPPANARVPDPSVQARQNSRIKAKAVEQSRVFAQGQHLRGGETAAQEVEQVEKTADKGLFAGQRLISDRPGDSSFLTGLAEDAGNRVSIALDIRGADQDVPGAQVRLLLEEIEQAVMQHLDLAQRRKTDMELHRPVVRMKGTTFHSGCGPIPEVEDVIVQVGQQMGLLIFLVEVSFMQIIFDQLPEEILADLAQRDQERMPLFIEGRSTAAD